mmetsp:Transcript_58676/g.164643  ORF Transcript_58676/g.164643 Transcript_58676/m.164643 type:complete len:257 (-) Transcript_58676:75-845(-)
MAQVLQQLPGRQLRRRLRHAREAAGHRLPAPHGCGAEVYRPRLLGGHPAVHAAKTAQRSRCGACDRCSRAHLRGPVRRAVRAPENIVRRRRAAEREQPGAARHAARRPAPRGGLQGPHGRLALAMQVRQVRRQADDGVLRRQQRRAHDPLQDRQALPRGPGDHADDLRGRDAPARPGLDPEPRVERPAALAVAGAPPSPVGVAPLLAASTEGRRRTATAFCPDEVPVLDCRPAAMLCIRRVGGRSRSKSVHRVVPP